MPEHDPTQPKVTPLPRYSVFHRIHFFYLLFFHMVHLGSLFWMSSDLLAMQSFIKCNIMNYNVSMALLRNSMELNLEV
ncbi:hypothetical protein, partial [Vibrio parahaemolyticus]